MLIICEGMPKVGVEQTNDFSFLNGFNTIASIYTPFNFVPYDVARKLNIQLQELYNNKGYR